MAETEESFKHELIKLAKIVEIIETSFIGADPTEIIINLNEKNLKYLSNNLNYNNEEKVKVSMGKVNFTFLKK
jgi:hypothetical protein